MVIASSFLQQQPCWAHRCSAKNRCSELPDHAIGLQCHMELTTRNLEQWIREDHNYIVSAMGPDGPERLRQDGERFGDLLERQGRRFISNALAFLTTQ